VDGVPAAEHARERPREANELGLVVDAERHARSISNAGGQFKTGRSAAFLFLVRADEAGEEDADVLDWHVIAVSEDHVR
jgi:hypothetical protein